MISWVTSRRISFHWVGLRFDFVGDEDGFLFDGQVGQLIHSVDTFLLHPFGGAGGRFGGTGASACSTSRRTVSGGLDLQKGLALVFGGSAAVRLGHLQGADFQPQLGVLRAKGGVVRTQTLVLGLQMGQSPLQTQQALFGGGSVKGRGLREGWHLLNGRKPLGMYPCWQYIFRPSGALFFIARTTGAGCPLSDRSH